MTEVTAPAETEIDVFLLYENEVDSYSGRSIFKSVYGSLEQAKEEIPEFALKYEREPSTRIVGPEIVIAEYLYYTIKKISIRVVTSD